MTRTHSCPVETLRRAPLRKARRMLEATATRLLSRHLGPAAWWTVSPVADTLVLVPGLPVVALPELEATCPAQSAVTDPLAGGILDGRFHLRARIGSGGTAEVYEAVDLRSRHRVAVKVASPRGRPSGDPGRAFAGEARILAALRPGIAPRLRGYGSGRSGEGPFLAMELLRGRTLQDVLMAGPHLSAADTLRVIIGVAELLVHLEAHALAHLDLKPANIHVGWWPDGPLRLRLLDFGIARSTAPRRPGQPGPAFDGIVKGTPQYLAPEQVLSKPVDQRTDFYALGCLMHVCVTSNPVFDLSDAPSLAYAQAFEPPPALPDVLPCGDRSWPELHRARHGLLQKDPEKRPQSAKECLSLLTGAAATNPNHRKAGARSAA